ncbi:hypothetical protein GE09DRAFT_1083177 [Coniochaeta sp. 2T2.1]|nr:hypothetical protein GE09DRAFT_1083177 [Coniochaeta sp. 2T2.1]
MSLCGTPCLVTISHLCPHGCSPVLDQILDSSLRDTPGRVPSLLFSGFPSHFTTRISHPQLCTVVLCAVIPALKRKRRELTHSHLAGRPYITTRYAPVLTIPKIYFLLCLASTIYRRARRGILLILLFHTTSSIICSSLRISTAAQYTLPLVDFIQQLPATAWRKGNSSLEDG